MKSTSLPSKLHELEIKTSLRMDFTFQMNFRVRMSGRRGNLGKKPGGKRKPHESVSFGGLSRHSCVAALGSPFPTSTGGCLAKCCCTAMRDCLATL